MQIGEPKYNMYMGYPPKTGHVSEDVEQVEGIILFRKRTAFRTDSLE